DGRPDPSLRHRGRDRTGRQITGDRMTALTLFALTKEERLFLWTGVLAVVIIAGALIIARIDRWRKRQMADGDDSPAHLGSFREMFERGELSRAEYDEVL